MKGHSRAEAMQPLVLTRPKPPLIPEYHTFIAGILSWIAR